MNATDEQALRQRIRDVLIQHRIMTLGVHDENGPWTAPVFYAQEDFDLVFVSNPKSRHGRAAASNPHWAASICNPNSQWREIQGLQMEGRVVVTSDEEMKRWRKIYIDKFPFTGAFFSQHEKLPEPLRAKVSDVRFFLFKPERIVLVDNTIHFGFHYEYRVQR